jgi:hypothetical protein
MRVFQVEVLVCPHGDATRRVLAAITAPESVAIVLGAMGLSAEVPEQVPARGPPGAGDAADATEMRPDPRAKKARAGALTGAEVGEIAVGVGVGWTGPQLELPVPHFIEVQARLPRRSEIASVRQVAFRAARGPPDIRRAKRRS